MSIWRDPTQSLGDYMNWGMILTPGAIACKDGSFIAAWAMVGIDPESMEEATYTAQMERISRGFASFRDDATFWVTLCRKSAATEYLNSQAGQGDDPLALIAAERAAILSAPGGAFRNELTMAVQWVPSDPSKGSKINLDLFETFCRTVEGRFRSILGLKRLRIRKRQDRRGQLRDCDAFMSHLGERTCGLPLTLSPAPKGEEAYVTHVLRPAFEQADPYSAPLIYGREAELLTIDGFPQEIGRDPFGALEAMPFDIQITMRFACQSKRATRAMANSAFKDWLQGGSSLFRQVFSDGPVKQDQNSLEMAQHAENTLAEIEREALSYGRFALTATVFTDPSISDPEARRARVDAAAHEVSEALHETGYNPRLERLNGLEAFLGSLPGHAHYNIRTQGISSRTFAWSMPSTSIWTGSRTNPAPPPLFPEGTPALLTGRALTGELFDFNLHVGEVGHGLIFGPTEGGKSVLLGLLAAQWQRYKDAQVIVFDKGRSMQRLTRALGGSVSIFNSEHGGVAPLEAADRLGAAWLERWIHTLTGVNNIPRTPARDGEVKTLSESFLASKLRSFEALARLTQDPDLRRMFDTYQTSESTAVLRGGQGYTGLGSTMTMIETEEIFNDLDERARVPLIDYLFEEVARRIDGRPTLIIMDEAWAYLKTPVFAERITSWLREGRKKNLALLMATQSLKDILDDDLMSVIMESCKTKIYLPSAGAQSDALKPQYMRLGLNEKQVENIATAAPKRDYYITQEGQERTVDFALGPATLTLIGQTKLVESAAAEAAWKEDPEFWREDVDRALAEAEQAEGDAS